MYKNFGKHSGPLLAQKTSFFEENDYLFHWYLHGGHTHLYSKKSPYHLAEEFNFDILSEWWFGADIVDLYRSLYVNLKSQDVSQEISKSFQDMTLPLIDHLQLEINKLELSSWVHMLWKKK